MTAPSFNYWFKIEQTVKSLEDGTSTVTFKFISKAAKDSTSTDLWPLITSEVAVVQTAGEFIPTESVGSYTIDNTPGTFGAYRKFSDILQRYTPIDQTVAVYVAETMYLSDNPTSWTQVAQGVCESVQTIVGSLTFQVRTELIPNRIMTIQVDPGLSDMADAPGSSIGKTLPLVLGHSVGVMPVRITADGSTSPKWALATTLQGHAQNYQSAAGFRAYMSKNQFGNWEAFSATAIYADNTGTTSTGTLALDTYFAYASILAFGSGTAGNIVTGCRLTAQANSTNPSRISQATLKVSVIRLDNFDEVAKGQVVLADYDSLNNNTANTSFNIDVSFEKPLFMSATNIVNFYGLAVSATNVASMELSLHYTTSSTFAYMKDSGSPVEWEYVPTTGVRLRARFWIASITLSETSTDTTPDRLGFTTLSFSQQAAGTGQTNPNFDQFPLLVVMHGLADTDATATGTAHTALTRPDQLIKSLQIEWNGSAWTDSGKWDFTTYSSAYSTAYADTGGIRTRRLKGIFDQRASFQDFLTTLCKDTASRIGIRQNGKLFLWPWGINQTPVANIPNADVVFLDWQIRNSADVVNRVRIAYDRCYVPADVENFDQAFVGENTELAPREFLEWDISTGSHQSALSSTSVSLFGRKERSEMLSTLISSQTAAETLAEYYMARHRFPLVYARVTLPYHRYKTLEMFDVVNIQCTEFPAFYGTSPEASEPVYGPADTGYYNLKDGYEWVRAETCRALIEERKLKLFPNQEPILEFTMQLLLNYPKDPT